MLYNEVKKWGKALGVSLVFFALYALYIWLRRETMSLSNINKCFGSAAILIAGFTLLIRPLMSRIQVFYQFMTIRRQLGLWAFVFAAIHVIISLFFIPNRFNLTWYIQEWVPVAFGVIALGIWVFLTYLSRNTKIVSLGSEKWQRYQRIGARIAFLFVYLHLIFLKYAGWVTWFVGKEKKASFLANPQFVPESLLIFVVMTIIILIKLYQIVKKGGDTHRITTTT